MWFLYVVTKYRLWATQYQIDHRSRNRDSATSLILGGYISQSTLQIMSVQEVQLGLRLRQLQIFRQVVRYKAFCPQTSTMHIALIVNSSVRGRRCTASVSSP